MRWTVSNGSVAAAGAPAVAVPDSADERGAEPDEEEMRFFEKTSSVQQTAPEPAVAPQIQSSAVTIHPARPAVPARSYEQLSAAGMQQGRVSRMPSAASLARDPRAYPTDPPRVKGAVKRIYVKAESLPDQRHRAPLSLRAREDQRRGQKSGEDV